MPIYEYKCENCGKVIEIFQKTIAEKPTCPNCGSSELQKLLSSPGAVMMGGSTPAGTTCCGRTERCDTPPCSTEGICRRD